MTIIDATFPIGGRADRITADGARRRFAAILASAVRDLAEPPQGRASAARPADALLLTPVAFGARSQ